MNYRVLGNLLLLPAVGLNFHGWRHGQRSLPLRSPMHFETELQPSAWRTVSLEKGPSSFLFLGTRAPMHREACVGNEDTAPGPPDHKAGSAEFPEMEAKPFPSALRQAAGQGPRSQAQGGQSCAMLPGSGVLWSE